MAVTLFLACVAIGAAAVASFGFALAEGALFSLRKWRLREMREKGTPRQKLVVELVDQPQDVLAAIILGNTVANGALVLAGLWAVWKLGWNFWLATAAVLFLMLFVCEIFPKTLALRSPEKWAMRLAPFLKLWRGATQAVRAIAQKVNQTLLRAIIPSSFQPRTTLNDEEYQELLEMAFQQGALGKAQKEIIFEILRLDRKTAREVMKPRSRMACIPDDLSVEEMLAAARKHKLPRLAIYDESPDTIVGILNTEALLLDPALDLSEVIEFPSFVPATMNLLQLLKSLQRQKRSLAIVLDEFGGTAGVVTMEDILEEMIGEFRRDEQARRFILEKLGEGKWRLSGGVRLDDFRREYPQLRDVYDVETIGGLLVEQLEVVPAPGQSAVVDGLRLTAQEADERRVREVIAETVRKGRER